MVAEVPRRPMNRVQPAYLEKMAVAVAGAMTPLLHSPIAGAL